MPKNEPHPDPHDHTKYTSQNHKTSRELESIYRQVICCAGLMAYHLVWEIPQHLQGVQGAVAGILCGAHKH